MFVGENKEDYAIFFDAKKTATKETVAVENFINHRQCFGNDLNSTRSANRRARLKPAYAKAPVATNRKLF